MGSGILGALAGLLAGAAIGVFLIAPGGEGDERRLDVDRGARSTELESQLVAARKELSAADARAEELARAVADLRSQLHAAQAREQTALRESEALRAELAEAVDPEAEKKRLAAAEDLRESAWAGLERYRKNPTQAGIDTAGFAELVDDLRQLDAEGKQWVRDLMKSEEESDRILAAMILMQLSDPGAVADLAEMAVSDESATAAAMATQALMRSDAPGALEALRKSAESPHEGARVNSLWGLARLGDERGKKDMIAYVLDESKTDYMRRALAHGALAIHDADLMPVVEHLVQ